MIFFCIIVVSGESVCSFVSFGIVDNFRVVEFATYGDMKNALVKLDGMEINGRKIKLVEDKPKSRRRRR